MTIGYGCIVHIIELHESRVLKVYIFEQLMCSLRLFCNQVPAPTSQQSVRLTFSAHNCTQCTTDSTGVILT